MNYTSVISQLEELQEAVEEVESNFSYTVDGIVDGRTSCQNRIDDVWRDFGNLKESLEALEEMIRDDQLKEELK